jgi:UDP-2-acetamido-3-amino-2,3-dideoxy-glucuronate N-acetyltransferase
VCSSDLNDAWPRSRQWQKALPTTTVRKGASIGANATILPGITIGQNAMVGAGSVVTRAVPPNAVVMGNPARLTRYTVRGAGDLASPVAEERISAKSEASQVGAVTFSFMPLIRDLRGNLTARELGKGLPFVPKRYFVISEVPSKEVRGEHAHKVCHQLLVSLNGSVACMVDDGANRTEYLLDTPEKALYIPPMIWGTQYKYSKDCVLLVLASHEYNSEDYIREYDKFLQAKKFAGSD